VKNVLEEFVFVNLKKNHLSLAKVILIAKIHLMKQEFALELGNKELKKSFGNYLNYFFTLTAQDYLVCA